MGSTMKEFSSNARANMRLITVSILSSEDIKKMSTVKIITPLVLNPLGHPLTGGLYDPAMGPMHEDSGACTTCNLSVFSCPGHMGYIELPLPVVNPLFYRPIGALLRNMCFTCNRLQLFPHAKFLAIAQLTLLDKGYLTSAKNAEAVYYGIDNLDKYSPDVEQSIRKRMDDYVEGELVKMEGVGVRDVRLVEAVRNEVVTASLKDYSSRKKCLYCSAVLVKLRVYKTRLLISKRLEKRFGDLDETVEENQNKTLNTSEIETKITEASLKKQGETKKRKGNFSYSTKTLSPEESKSLMRNLWNCEKEYIKLMFPVLKNSSLEYPVDLWFLDVVPVIPPNARPANVMREKVIEHPQTLSYKRVVQDSLILKNVMVVAREGNTDILPPEGKMLYQSVHGKTVSEKLHYAWEALQFSVDALMDNSLHPNHNSTGEGLKQVIEKKEGVIRMHVMGKRVNFASRSVITPDPNLNIDEVGLPEAFAKKLTFPVPVTPWNVNELRNLVLNGPLVHPGACMIENNDGSVTRIPAGKPIQRKALANMLLMPDERLSKFSKGVKIVHRHLVNGDILLMNRQPTLHRPSIMAHRARVLKGEKTLRLHYANCKSYNADFDGDEMNAHCPQSELARSEAFNLVNVCNQYLVPKDGTPLSGLIQDHMVSGVRLSMRGRFFTREDYMQLVYQSVAHIRGEIVLLPPAVLKPATLWSGKQIVSTVLINIIPRDQPRINLTASAKIGNAAWIREAPRQWRAGGTPLERNAMSEAEVVIRQGELLCGVLDKTHYGATAYGLVHCVYELYGGKCANDLLTAFGKLFMAFLQLMEGFTLGVEDILVLDSADEERARLVKESRGVGTAAAVAVLGIPPDTSEGDLAVRLFEAYNDPRNDFRAEIDLQYKSILNGYTDKINKACLPGGLLRKFPDNNLQLMVMSGAKGSTVNTMQISCLLGQIELEGKRPPLMVSGRSLPSFAPFDCQPRAGGFVDGRFLTGIQPQEFFFHCMAGREGLIDTAVKTSRSGYLQRCLVKHLEGLSVTYDMTVRDSDGSVIQFAYGEDGMDVTKMPFLKAEHMHFMYENRDAIARKDDIEALKDSAKLDSIKDMKKLLKKWDKSYGREGKVRVSPFLEFTRTMEKELPSCEWKMDKKTGRSTKTKVLVRAWRKINFEHNNRMARPDPVASTYPSSIHFSAIPERVESILEDYLKNGNGRDLSSKDKKEFRDIIYCKVLSASCHAGDPVGVLAAQSVGEPSTQMTLNTFHFAGRGEMNVTLGIPRLKEILMTASKKIKTPAMAIPFRSGIKPKKANRLKAKLTKLRLSDVLEFVEVTETLSLQPERMNVYTLVIHFLPYELYKDEYSVNPRKLLTHIEHKFIGHLLMEIKRVCKMKADVVSSETEEKEKKGDAAEEGDEEGTQPKKQRGTGEHHVSSDEDEDDPDDADATEARLKQKRRDGDQDDESEAEDDESSDEEAGEEVVAVDKDSNADEQEDEEIEDELETAKLSELAEKRKAYVLNRHRYVQDYKYDLKSEEWCKIRLAFPVNVRRINLSSVLRAAAEKSIVYHVPGINRAFVANDKDGGLILKTDGLNMYEIVKHSDVLDVNRLYANDVHAVAAKYGIEAAGRVLVREIQEVFKVYGIEVDPRHLMLISDYLTAYGSFMGMNRKALENNPSYLQKMSFEASLQFLKSAVWGGRTEFLQSPSSRIFIGYPLKSGTGAFEVLQRLAVGAS